MRCCFILSVSEIFSCVHIPAKKTAKEKDNSVAVLGGQSVDITKICNSDNFGCPVSLKHSPSQLFWCNLHQKEGGQAGRQE